MKLKKIISIILTASIVSTNFPLIIQAGEQTEEAVIQVAQEVEEIGDEVQALPKPEYEEKEDKVQTAPKPAEITDQFNIDSKEKFIEFMTTPKYHANNWETTLLCDIDMEDVVLKAIGIYYGKFNGNGHTINNISFQGFVRVNLGIISNAIFKNIKIINTTYGADAGFVFINKSHGVIENCSIETNDNNSANIKAGFVGYNSGKIIGCTAIAPVSGNRDEVAGFVFSNKGGGEIINCTSWGAVTGKDRVGGFACENAGKITDSTATGNVTGHRDVGGFVVENLGIIDTCMSLGNINGEYDSGGFVYYNKENGNITNCKAEGNVTSCCELEGSGDAGGFVGWNGGTITNCKAEGDVSGYHRCVGGFVGYNIDGIITNSKSEGNVTGNVCVGGFVAHNFIGTITNCTATGSVTGKEKVGGFVGANGGSRKITNCTATGSVTGKEKVGGFVGENFKGEITNCKIGAVAKVSGKEKVGGFVGLSNCEGTITNCKIEAVVEVKGVTEVGGFVGVNEGATITNCKIEAVVKVRGVKDVGGFAGLNDVGTITKCMAQVYVTGNERVGGFIGYNDNEIFSNIRIITECAVSGNVTGNNCVGGFVGENRWKIKDRCISEVNVQVQGNGVAGLFVAINKGQITDDCIAFGEVRHNNNAFGIIGNGKELDKKDVALGTIIAMMLGGTIGGVALKTVGVDKTISALKSMLESVRNYFNEKVMTNSNYKKVIGALIALGIALIIIIPISLSKKKHVYNAIGGFVGKNEGYICNCTSIGKVTVKGVPIPIEAGGFAGQNGITGEIINCSAEVEVNVSTKSSGKAGGFVGNNNGRICGSKYIGRRVYLSTGKLYKDDCCGGIAGKNSIGGVIDGCEVGGVNVETKSNVKRGTVILETKNKTKGGGILGVAGKGSVTMNCECKARRKTKVGEVVAKVCYKTEKGSILKNNKVY